MLTTLLVSQGANVLAAADERTAKSLIATEMVDVGIVALNATTDDAMRLARGTSLPLVAIAGIRSPERPCAQGFKAVLPKIFEPHRLLETVERILVETRMAGAG
jgi:hypothetical protein